MLGPYLPISDAAFIKSSEAKCYREKRNFLSLRQTVTAITDDNCVRLWENQTYGAEIQN